MCKKSHVLFSLFLSPSLFIAWKFVFFLQFHISIYGKFSVYLYHWSMNIALHAIYLILPREINAQLYKIYKYITFWWMLYINLEMSVKFYHLRNYTYLWIKFVWHYYIIIKIFRNKSTAIGQEHRAEDNRKYI